MKRVLLAGVALAALMGSASAADIPRRVVERPVAAPVPHVVAYNWTGFYVGLNGGWGWGADTDGSGGLAGGTLGYNWQMNQVVFGLEADIAWSGIESDGDACRRGLRCEASIDWLGTARGRVGLAMDRFMPYVAGGLAYGDVNARATGLPDRSDMQAGWTLGAGMEFALTAPWTAKLEYLYVDLGDLDNFCGRRCGPGGPNNAEFNAHIIRAGVNYRF